MESNKLLNILENLLKPSHETATVEFKHNFQDPKTIGAYISALANTALLEGHDRAWMVWGIEDKTHKIVGTTFSPKKEKVKGNQSLEMWLTQLVSPRPYFNFYEVNHPDGRVVMLEIFPPRASPLTFDNIRYIRIDSHTTKLSAHADKEARIFEILSRQGDWTEQVVANATLQDLDPKAVAFARKQFSDYLQNRNAPDVEKAEKWDDITLLNKALITKEGGITNAALLLLGRDESQHFLSPADTKISWILRDAQNNHISGQHFGLPFLLSAEAVLQKIRNVKIDYMPAQGTLFPTSESQYDEWVIREALHNCIAHQDYSIGGKINLTEHPDKLVFANMGRFIPPNVEWVLKHDSPPASYRNQWLVGAMIRLKMIEQMGSGIKKMFMTQRNRFFPLPSYTLHTTPPPPYVELRISGKILDIKYTQLLIKRTDLTLDEVVLLDKIQKNIKIPAADAKSLKDKGLIEGRSPNYYISSKLAEVTEEKESYIRNKSFDDSYFEDMILKYIQQYGLASRQNIDRLLLEKLSDILDADKKRKKIDNLLQSMRKRELIKRIGTSKTGTWQLTEKNA
jgi:ATP-dependent DNA helicase RecG